MRPSEPLRIIVADDFPPFREALRQFFDAFAAFEIVGEAADHYGCENARLDGVEATRRIKRVFPAIHVVGISTQEDTVTKAAMTTAGCSAFVTKECAHTLPAVIAKLTGRQELNESVKGFV